MVSATFEGDPSKPEAVWIMPTELPESTMEKVVVWDATAEGDDE